MNVDEVDFIIYGIEIFALLAVLFYGYKLYILAGIEKRGVPAQGKITDKFTRRYKFWWSYYFRVEFQAGSKTVESSYRVPALAWDEARERSEVPVIYLPENPKKCHHPALVSKTWNIMAIRGVFFLAVLAIMVVMGFIDPEWHLLDPVIRKEE